MIATQNTQICETGQFPPDASNEHLLTALNERFEEDNPWLLVHTTDNVFFARRDQPNTKAALNPEKIRTLRAFTCHAEMHVWRQMGQLRWRFRHDSDGGDSEVFDQKQVLWGDHISDSDATVAEEKGRGCRIQLPVDLNDDMLPLQMVVRNYIKYDKNGLLCFNDARVLKITQKNGEPIHG